MTNMSDHDSPNVRFIPPLMFALCLIVGASLEALSPSTLPWLPTVLRYILGGVLVLGGFAFMMWGHSRFRALGVTVKTIRPASRLVTVGAYRFSRNPMYTGMVSLIAGIGFAAENVWMLLASVLMALYLALYVIPREEAYLLRRFGEDYKTYCTTVRRWL
jgi:protein-S-isoprenylcysteine O-methyltransferase Ste14